MTYISAVVFLVLVGASPVLGNISVTDCAKDKANELLTTSNIYVSPYPVRIPGTVRVSGTLKLNRNITVERSLSLSLKIERKVAFFWVKVPCINNVGSCSYSSICSWIRALYANGCPAVLPCSCPVPSGTYSVTDVTYDIPKLTGSIAALANGDFRATVTVDRAGTQVACQKVHVTVKSVCSGFLCGIFG